MKNYFLILSFLFSINTISSAQNFVGDWQFKSITNLQNENILPINFSDEMTISEDATFEYTLAAKNNLQAKGEWTVSNDLLCFNYSSPADTLRCYKYNYTDNILLLTEGAIKFTFDVYLNFV